MAIDLYDLLALGDVVAITSIATLLEDIYMENLNKSHHARK